MPDRIAHPCGGRTPYARGAEWPVRVDTHLTAGVAAEDVDAWVPTASILHSNGDALDIAVKDGRIVGVRGRADSRVNRGRLGRRPESGLLLLRDLRELHLAAARASLAWTALGQGARAVSDTDLLATVSDCHPETIRTMRWTVQKVKDASPQVLAS